MNVKTDAGASEPQKAAGGNTAMLPYIVAAAYFMEYLDTTVISTALPQMARSFSVTPNEVSLGMTAYMLTLAVFIPISGWIADRFGSQTVFGAALGVFTVASILCGFSTGIASFTAARVLQGMGGAMMVPVGRTIVVCNTDKGQLMRAISTITWPAILAPVVGPTVGGAITTYASWHWVFFMNVPFAVAGLAAIIAFVPNQRGATRTALDLPGFILSGTALVCLLYGTELASHEQASVLGAVGWIAAGLLAGVLAISHLKRAKAPLLTLSVLKVPTYSVTVLWGSATRIGIEAVPYLTPLMLQLGFGLSAFHAGLMLLATAIGNIGMKFFTTRIIRRFSFRTVLMLNGAVAAILILLCGQLAPSMPLAIMLLILFGYGLARSLQFAGLGSLAYADVGDSQKSPASTLWSVAQQMTIGMGIAFSALSLRVAASLRPIHGRYALADFRWAFAVAGLVTLMSIIGYARLPREAGRPIGGGARR